MVIEGKLSSLTVPVKGHDLKFLVYLLPVSAIDLILGSSWLATLSPHLMGYATLSLKFYHEESSLLKVNMAICLLLPQLNHIRRLRITFTKNLLIYLLLWWKTMPFLKPMNPNQWRCDPIVTLIIKRSEEEIEKMVKYIFSITVYRVVFCDFVVTIGFWMSLVLKIVFLSPNSWWTLWC